MWEGGRDRHDVFVRCLSCFGWTRHLLVNWFILRNVQLCGEWRQYTSGVGFRV